MKKLTLILASILLFNTSASASHAVCHAIFWPVTSAFIATTLLGALCCLCKGKGEKKEAPVFLARLPRETEKETQPLIGMENELETGVLCDEKNKTKYLLIGYTGCCLISYIAVIIPLMATYCKS